MADVLRLQGKPGRDVKRYLDKARSRRAARRRARGRARGLLARDGKLDDARAAFAAIDSGDGALESTGDVRARFHLALALLAQNKPADAKPLVDQILAAQPDHDGARALAAKLETVVAKTDPMPPEDGTTTPARRRRRPARGRRRRTPSTTRRRRRRGRLRRAGRRGATSSPRHELQQGDGAVPEGARQKPNGVEALTGMGYCHLDAKQFSSAFSKFRAALAVSSRYEPALSGIAETYQQQGNKEQAIESWQNVARRVPGLGQGEEAARAARRERR